MDWNSRPSAVLRLITGARQSSPFVSPPTVPWTSRKTCLTIPGWDYGNEKVPEIPYGRLLRQLQLGEKFFQSGEFAARHRRNRIIASSESSMIRSKTSRFLYR
jgi:hypothetical protein